MLLKKALQVFQTIRNNNKEITAFLQEQNKLLIEENKLKTAIIEMLVESQNKSRKDQKSSEKFEVIKYRKYRKRRSIENEWMEQWPSG